MNAIEKIFVPHEIVNDEYVKIVQCAFADCDLIKAGDCVGAVETSKMVVNVYAKEGGYIKYFCREKDEVKVGALLARVYTQAADIHLTDALPPAVSPWTGRDFSTADNRFSRAALALMDQYCLEASVFKDRDLVSAQDVLAYIQDINKKERKKESSPAILIINLLLRANGVRLKISPRFNPVVCIAW